MIDVEFSLQFMSTIAIILPLAVYVILRDFEAIIGVAMLLSLPFLVVGVISVIALGGSLWLTALFGIPLAVMLLIFKLEGK